MHLRDENIGLSIRLSQHKYLALRVAVPVCEMVKLRVATYLDAAIPGGFPLLSPLNPCLVESSSQLFDTSVIETYTTRV